jgi:hypothetical protein
VLNHDAIKFWLLDLKQMYIVIENRLTDEVLSVTGNVSAITGLTSSAFDSVVTEPN